MGWLTADGAFSLIKDLAKRVTTDKDLQLKFEGEMQQMVLNGDIRKYEADVEDRKSAREREMKMGGTMTAFLGGSIVIGFFGVLFFVISGRVPADVDQMYVGALLGTLGTMAVQVMNYYFGSSQGSKLKTEFMGKK